MRRIVARRNTRILSVLFFASAFLFYQAHAGVFLKELAEKRIEAMLPAGTHVALGGMEGGVFRNLVSENVRVFSREDRPSFNIERMELDYRFWYPVIKKIPYLSKRLAEKEGKKLDFTGHLDFNKKDRLLVKGFIAKGKPSHIRIAQEKGYVDLDIMEKEEGKFAVNAEMTHVKINNMDIIAKCAAHFNTAEKKRICAQINFKDIIINYTPFGKNIEVSLDYDKEKGLVTINEFKVAKEIKGDGKILVGPGGYLSLKWNVIDLALGDYFNKKNVGENVSGMMNGSFSLKGPLGEPLLSAHMDIQKGNFGTIIFNSVIGNLKGKGTVVSIVDSRIIAENGTFQVGGSVDLAKLNDKNAFKGITFNSEENFFMWEGWSVKKETKDASVKAEKLVNEDLAVSFKAHTKDDKSEEERFVGVERKVKF